MAEMERYIVTVGEKEHDLKIQSCGNEYLLVNESGEYKIIAEKLAGGRFLMRFGASPEEIIVRPAGGTLNVFIGGRQYDVRVEAYGLAELRRKSGSASGNVKDKFIKTPMPGLVLAAEVKPGDEVKKDQTLIIIEAMKMENMIKAPAAGIVRAVFVTAGQAVERYDKLVELE